MASSDVCRGLEENLWSLWSRSRGMQEAETCPGMGINLDDLPPQQA
jgi:hypothetical protein